MINATCISRGHGFTDPSRKEVDNQTETALAFKHFYSAC